MYVLLCVGFRVYGFEHHSGCLCTQVLYSYCQTGGVRLYIVMLGCKSVTDRY